VFFQQWSMLMSPSNDNSFELSDELAPSDLAPVYLEEALGRRGLRRRRVFGTIIAALLCAAFAAVVSYPLVGRIIPALVFPSSNHIGIQVIVATNITTANVFTVNGHKRPERMAVSFTPRDGDNTVVLAAPPFATHTCHFRWFNREITDTNGQCQAAGDSFVGDSSGIHSQEDEITMPLMPADLPSGQQQQAATEAIQQLASPPQTITVPKGDYYALGLGLGKILSQQTTIPLTATFATVPDLNNLEPITLFLDGSGQTRHFPDHAWLIRANMLGSWQFTTSDGGVAGGIAMATSAALQAEFALDYTRSSFSRLPFTPYGEKYSPSETFPCENGIHILQEIYSTLSPAPPSSDCVDRGLAGSVFSLIDIGSTGPGEAGNQSVSDGTPGVTPDPVPPRFVYRFGVLLAANAPALAAAPGLPQAPADEIAALDG
jgi:hypothetical protein